MKHNIIDFEASALKNPSFPVQVAVIKSDGSTYDAYIRPTDNWIDNYVWDPESEGIHGISLSTLMEIGRPVDEVAAELNEFIDGEVVYCDGGEYDQRWVKTLYCETPKVNQRFSMNCISELFKGAFAIPIWLLKDAAEIELGLPAHDALNDVKIIQTAVDWRIRKHIPRIPT